MSLKNLSKGLSSLSAIKYILPLILLVFLLSGFSLFKFKNANAQNVHPLPIVAQQYVPACPGPVSKGHAKCHALVVVHPDAHGHGPGPTNTPTPTPVPLYSGAYGPVQFHTAYNLPTTANGNPIIAIVDAYDDPTAYQDLTTYSQTYGIPVLPQCSGTIANSSSPCFAKIDQNGGTSYPNSNSGWGMEISLDVQVAHATCQNCRILLIEANSSSFTDLLTAENQALAQGAMIVSNSWSAGEFSTETSYDSIFNHPGVVFAFASGDSGYSGGTQYPSASPYVVSVGGTTLQINSNNTYYNETAWNGAGSGCSAYEPKPSWQNDSGCANRMTTDVSADADPNTGAAVLDSSYSPAGWYQVGGTSLATPLIASVYALAGPVGSNMYAASIPYSNFMYLHDVTSGSTGNCSTPYFCNALVGYDGPTGNGTPNGLGGFSNSSVTPTPTPTGAPTPSPTAGPTVTPTPTSALTPTPTPVHGHGHGH